MKKISFELRPLLVLSVVLIILCTALSVGIPLYLSSKDSLETLWGHLSSQIANGTTERTLRFLHNAKPFTEVVTKLAQAKELDLDNDKQILDLCYFTASSFPRFAWVSYIKTDGTFLAAYNTEEGTVEATKRTIDVSKTPSTLIQNYEMDQNDNFKLIKEYRDTYDPRTRPFWKNGLNTKEGAWSNPYTLYSTKEPAVAFSKPQYLGDTLVGMWIIEYTIASMNDYLRELKIAIGSDGFLITNDGSLIARSTIISAQGNKPLNINELSSSDEENSILKKAWKASRLIPDHNGTFYFDDYFAHIQPFPKESMMPWNVLTIIPKASFFGTIDRQAWITLTLSLGLCAFFAILGALFFGHISKRLKNIADEMQAIGSFRFSDISLIPKSSFVTELNMMNKASDRMKVGIGSFAKYVPIDLVHDLIASGQPATLSGRKIEMSILFSDIEGFTDLAERLSADELLELLGDYLTAMSETISSCSGEVDKFIGDAIMAFWGAPKPLDKHAHFACLGALAMKHKLDELHIKWKSESKPLLYQRIGINTGLMVVGNIGSPRRMEYTAIGDAVNLASRLEGLNKYYKTQILLGENTAKQVMNEFVVRPIDYVSVKGKINSTLIYELVGTKEETSAHTLEAVNTYTLGLEAYRKREFSKSKKYFEEASKLFDEKDKVSIIMIERASQYLKEPPPEDWKGVTIMTQK